MSPKAFAEDAELAMKASDEPLDMDLAWEDQKLQYACDHCGTCYSEVEYVERGGRDTYCAVMQPFKKRCLAEWLAVNSSPKLKVNSTKDGVVVAFMRRDGVADIRHTPRQTASSSDEPVLQIVLAGGDRLRKKLEKK